MHQGDAVLNQYVADLTFSLSMLDVEVDEPTTIFDKQTLEAITNIFNVLIGGAVPTIE